VVTGVATFEVDGGTVTARCEGGSDGTEIVEAPLPAVPDLNIEGPAGVYYDDCQEAVAMGTAPVLAGENGYREELDSDSDGVGCETY
jgi:hypothetical protein